jgi:hypothetical protein
MKNLVNENKIINDKIKTKTNIKIFSVYNKNNNNNKQTNK